MIIINFEEHKMKQRVCFHCNPLVEMTASLHMLSNPEHHEACRKWASKVTSGMEASLRKQMSYYATNYAQWLFIMDVITALECDHYEDPEWEAGDVCHYIKALKNMDNSYFAYMFLGFSAFHMEMETLERWIADPDNIPEEELKSIHVFISENNVKVFLKNVAEAKKRLCNFLQRFWDEVFSKEWTAIEPHIQTAIESEKIALAKHGIFNYILKNFNGIEMSGDKCIIHKEIDYTMEVRDIANVHIFPSMFTAPHTMMDIRENELVLYYNLSFHSLEMTSAVPVDLLEMMKALADENRMKILRIIWREPTSTQKIASILNLAPSTVSVHLKIMKKANLIVGRQVKKFVYYEAIKENVNDVWPRFDEYISE